MESNIGLIVQFAGVLLITVLSLFLRRSLKTAASGYWAIGWACLSFALFCLNCVFIYKDAAPFLIALYCVGEYVFCLMLIFGFCALAGEFKCSLRGKLLFTPLFAVSICLPLLTKDLVLIFAFHTLLFTVFFAAALYRMTKLRIEGFGTRVMSVAVALLTVDFGIYFALLLLIKLNVNLPLSQGYQTFSPIIDLILEVMLAFGMIIVLLEQVLQKMQNVNEELQKAHAKLQQTANTDSLTTALNRHAFYGFVSKSGAEQTNVSGCVGFFDIDDLKPINDQYGHAVGDLAIRATVSAIRKLIRAEDLIYRWGGDEFFVLLVSMDEEMARARMKKLDSLLTDLRFEGMDMSLRVSYGFKDFSDISDLDQAIKAADEEMYRFKRERKQMREVLPQTKFFPTENKTAFPQTV